MPLHALPDSARLWLVALQAPPDQATQARLRHGLAELLAQWRHKGQAYQGEGVLLEPQLIAIAEPNLATQPSGCAIDGMLRKLHRLLEQLNLTPVDPAATLLVRAEGRLLPIAKPDIPSRLEDGTLAPATPVLDLSLYSLEDLRAGRLEAPLSNTWVARRYQLPRTVPA